MWSRCWGLFVVSFCPRGGLHLLGSCSRAGSAAAAHGHHWRGPPAQQAPSEDRTRSSRPLSNTPSPKLNVEPQVTSSFMLIAALLDTLLGREKPSRALSHSRQKGALPDSAQPLMAYGCFGFTWVPVTLRGSLPFRFRSKQTCEICRVSISLFYGACD